VRQSPPTNKTAGALAAARNKDQHRGVVRHHPGFTTKGQNMDKDRVKGAAHQAKGAVKEAAGKVTGDAKLKSEGKAEKTAGKVQNAVGGLKDAARGK
jgi:uncharacterized protein YjbJ (UPF0337 family)